MGSEPEPANHLSSEARILRLSVNDFCADFSMALTEAIRGASDRYADGFPHPDIGRVA